MTKRDGRHKHLTAEDRALWGIVTHQTAPLINHVRVTGHEHLDFERALETLSELGSKESGTASSHAGQGGDAVTPATRARQGIRRPRASDAGLGMPSPQAGLAKFDEKTARKLRTGRTSIDARLDLHGLTQEQAHHTLRGFLNGAAGRGCRHVLVITGKGRTVSSPSDFGFAGAGVLKRMVPVWLSSPELAHIVISYTTAHDRHGGDGALYVWLRSNSKRRAR